MIVEIVVGGAGLLAYSLYKIVDRVLTHDADQQAAERALERAKLEAAKPPGPPPPPPAPVVPLRDDETILPFESWVEGVTKCGCCGAIEHTQLFENDDDEGPCPPTACENPKACTERPHLHVHCVSCGVDYLIAPAYSRHATA